ncbi:hypothetical protein FE257_005934 [Aspergillus nanangensis]|uniref:NAD(P)-binding domain-containing protein n=1 Tax=Aspergillus nanangensis TaxID=2582783 RepID=A0AAD4CPZ6_ASPNN|nr:hypothetical protein FE257_005934 [Aspergillus nanangensis]
MHLKVDEDVPDNHLPLQNILNVEAGLLVECFKPMAGNIRSSASNKLDYCGSVNNFSPIIHMENFHFIKGNICCLQEVERTLAKYDIDAIVHFAARSHVDQSFGDPLAFTYTNVIGTQVLLEASRKLGSIKRFIYVSTDEVYGENNQTSGFKEDQNLHPTNPYSASKAAAEMVAEAYRISFQMPIIITRCNNVFGPYQYPDKVIPKFINFLRNGEKMTIHGDGQSTRSYLYAEDAAEALDVIFHRGSDGETYNIASRNLLDVREVARKVFNALGLHHTKCLGDWIQHIDDRPFNDRMYWTNDSKLRCLGWGERTDFDLALDQTVTWYHDHGEEFWA